MFVSDTLELNTVVSISTSAKGEANYFYCQATVSIPCFSVVTFCMGREDARDRCRLSPSKGHLLSWQPRSVSSVEVGLSFLTPESSILLTNQTFGHLLIEHVKTRGLGVPVGQ